MSTTTAHAIALVNMKDGSVQGHKAGCADLKKTKDHEDAPWTPGKIGDKNTAWLAYNSDFIAECDEHEDFCNEDRGICFNARDIDWFPCADHIPSGEETTTPESGEETTAPKPAAPQVTINGSAFKGCACHCGQPVPSRSTYRPGHDARHAGQVARDAVDPFRHGQGAVDSPEFYVELEGRPALAAKARKMALGIVAKAEGKKAAKTGRSIPAQDMTGEVKIGRWTYPARMTIAGKVQRNTKRDGSGSWVALGPKEEVVWN